MKLLTWLATLVLIGGLSAAEKSPQDKFWDNLKAMCGQAFEGKMVEGTAASDDDFKGKRMVMHVRACSDTEIRIPFFVGEDRSRTWVIMRTANGLRLKHDHRHEDGSEDAVTQYGGDTKDVGLAGRQEFHADAFTANLIPAAASNIWTMLIDPGKVFGYGLRRDAENRRFRVEFDLTKPVATPLPPWGTK